jgi:predicted ATP-binding protein involved in virulence
MDLLSEMCLNRNYNVINTIQNDFSFEILFSIMKSDKEEVDYTLKARVDELMLRLQVDREPLEKF